MRRRFPRVFCFLAEERARERDLDLALTIIVEVSLGKANTREAIRERP